MPQPVADIAGLRALLAEAEQWVRVPAPPGRHLLLAIAGRPDGADDGDLARIEALAESGPACALSPAHRRLARRPAATAEHDAYPLPGRGHRGQRSAGR